MASRIGVSTPTSIYPAGLQAAITLKNVGENDLYVDSLPMPVGIPAGFPLGKGSSMVWDSGRPLYASSPLGSELLISENSGNLFDAQAIAAEIVAGDLAQEIANRIAIGGVPPIDRRTLLVRDIQGANPTSVTLDPTEMSQGNSWEVVVGLTGMTPALAGAFEVALVGSYASGDIAWEMTYKMVGFRHIPNRIQFPAQNADTYQLTVSSPNRTTIQHYVEFYVSTKQIEYPIAYQDARSDLSTGIVYAGGPYGQRYKITATSVSNTLFRVPYVARIGGKGSLQVYNAGPGNIGVQPVVTAPTIPIGERITVAPNTWSIIPWVYPAETVMLQIQAVNVGNVSHFTMGTW